MRAADDTRSGASIISAVGRPAARSGETRTGHL